MPNQETVIIQEEAHLASLSSGAKILLSHDYMEKKFALFLNKDGEHDVFAEWADEQAITLHRSRRTDLSFLAGSPKGGVVLHTPYTMTNILNSSDKEYNRIVMLLRDAHITYKPKRTSVTGQLLSKPYIPESLHDLLHQEVGQRIAILSFNSHEQAKAYHRAYGGVKNEMVEFLMPSQEGIHYISAPQVSLLFTYQGVCIPLNVMNKYYYRPGEANYAQVHDAIKKAGLIDYINNSSSKEQSYEGLK